MRAGTTSPLQSGISMVQGDPNGHFDGPKGLLCVDTEEPALYQKTAVEGIKTWIKLFGQNGALRQVYGGTTNPNDAGLIPDNPNEEAQYEWRGDAPVVVWWDIATQQWNLS